MILPIAIGTGILLLVLLAEYLSRPTADLAGDSKAESAASLLPHAGNIPGGKSPMPPSIWPGNSYARSECAEATVPARRPQRRLLAAASTPWAASAGLNIRSGQLIFLNPELLRRMA